MRVVRQLRFQVTGDALYAANTGRPFDRLGLLALSRAHLSTKGRWPPIETFDCGDDALVDAMREGRLNLYRGDPNQIRSDFNQEHETGQSYEDRCIWELLQNADDAMAPDGASSAELIGAKGLGFKSVLEFTDRPAVFSGPFRFEFDVARSRELLKPIDADPPPLVFHLPHNAEADAVVARFLREGFATVVRVPFRNAQARKEASDRLRALTPYFLLLSQHLQTVAIGLEDGSRRLLNRKGPVGSELVDARVQLSVSEDGTIGRREWRVWSRTWASSDEKGKRLSAAIAVPTSGMLESEDANLPLHVFYPTREAISAPFLVHAAFTLTHNRNNIVSGDHDAALIKEVGRMAGMVAVSVPPLQALRLFEGVARNAPNSSKLPARRLQKAIADAVAASAFIPVVGHQDTYRPAETRVWQHELGSLLPSRNQAIAAKRLAAPAMAEAFSTLQHVFKARPLYANDYAAALSEVRCRTIEECRVAVAVAQSACLASTSVPQETFDYLAKASMWPTASGAIRSLAEGDPLVAAPVDDWPSWLQSDVLHPDFSESAGDANLPPQVRTHWAKLLKGRLLRTRDDWLAHALAPAVGKWNDEQWADHGWDALKVVRDWLPDLEFRVITPLVPGLPDQADGVRERLANAMRAPSRKTWVPTIDAYASEEIGGADGLAKFIRGRSDRYLIGAPKGSSSVRPWRALLRYLGVSWEPKIRRLPEWSPWLSRFQAATDYSFRYALPDWHLEFFPECIADTGSVSVLKMLESLAPVTATLPARWGKVSGSEKVHRVPNHGSYANWQLRQERYLKCSPGIGPTTDRYAPNEAYWPEHGLRGITPIVDLRNVDGVRRRVLKTLLVSRLGVQDSLPTDASVWLGWARGVANDPADQKRLSLREIRGFYEAALDAQLPTSALASAPLVCETAAGLQTSSGKAAIWIDDPDLASPEVQEALRHAGQAIFPVQLGRGDRVEDMFGVRRASSVLKLRPVYTQESKGGTDGLQQRLRGRRRALAVTFDVKGRRWSAPEVVAVHGLTLQICLFDQVVSTRAVLAHQEGGLWRVSIDANRWEALARACVGSLPPAIAADLRRRVAAILSADRQDVTAVLIEDGVPAYRLTDLVLEDDDDHAETAPGDLGEEEDPPPTAPELADRSTAENPIPKPSLDDIKNTPEPKGPPKLGARPLYGSGGGRGSGSSRSQSRSAAGEAAERASARGQAAEAWFALAVDKTLPDGWVVRFNERDAGLRESDVVISNDHGRWHVEVKSLTTERLHWSELERSKAEGLRGRYFMALLVGTHEQGYHVFWVWDPLVEFGTLERRIDWVWSDTDEGPPLPPMKWAPEPGLGKPQRPPTRWTHVVQVTEAALERFFKGHSDLQALWDRCASSPDPAPTAPEALANN